VISTEWDATLLSQPSTSVLAAQSALGMAGMFQADFEVIQGLHLSATGEFLNSKLSSTANSFGGWATFWWFLAPRIDIRGDVVLQNLPAGVSRTSATTLLAQIHAYL
jgi:hypothetical protein